MIRRADIITNSGHLRPLDALTIDQMSADSVIPLMYEAWELRSSDVDLEACRRRGVLTGGTNERHPAIDVFGFLGIMAVKQLLDAGVSVYSGRILLLCDNPFRSYIEHGLVAAGASVGTDSAAIEALSGAPYDAVVVALQPGPLPVLAGDAVQRIAAHSPDAVVVQYWGDLDRNVIAAAGLSVWPETAPPCGHMGVLPAATGPESTVRLQCGGLKAGEVLWKRSWMSDSRAAEFVEVVQ
jgi:hypothetical protein